MKPSKEALKEGKWLKAGIDSNPNRDVRSVAETLGIHPSAVYKIFNGKRRLAAHEIITAAQHLGIAPIVRTEGSAILSPTDLRMRPVTLLQDDAMVEVGRVIIGGNEMRLFAMAVRTR